MIDIIEGKVPLCERLAGLAEEAAELAQAALKYRRALDGTNPTPMDDDTAYEKMLEEIADVKLYLSTIPINIDYIEGITKRKQERWILRLKKQEEKER